MIETTDAMSPVSVLTRREGAMAEIRRAVVLGTLRPGDKLTELGLATTLRVSRPTVREALSQLAREGLLVAEPYRGLRVADLDDAAVRDIAQTRVALDRLATTGILDDGSGRRLADLEAVWRRFERLVRHPDPMVRHDAHLAFHRGVWMASENALLAQLWPVVEANLTIALAADQATRPDPERAHRMHAELVAAIRSRRSADIEATLTAHISDSADELIALRATEKRKTP